MGLIVHFRILKALIILFLLFPNQNRTVLQEALTGFNSDAVKTTLNRLHYFKMTFPFLQVFQKSFLIPLSLPLSHTIESITNGSVVERVTFTLVGFTWLGLVSQSAI